MKSKINANRALVAEKSKFNKFLTLLAVLTLGITNVWAEDFTITPITGSYLSPGNLVKITYTGDLKTSSTQIQTTDKNKSGVITLTAIAPGVYLKSASFTDANWSTATKRATLECTSGGSIVGVDGVYTFTASDNATTATISVTAGTSGAAKLGSVSLVVTNGTTNDIETYSTFAKTGNDFSFTAQCNGASITPAAALSSSTWTVSSNNISAPSSNDSKTITISSDNNIKFIALYDSNCRLSLVEKSSSGGTCDGASWSVGSTPTKSVTFKNGISTSLTITKVFVITEAASKHTVTYVLNGGTGTTPTQADVAEGAKFTLHDGTTGITAPASKEFDGWHDGTTKYAGGAEYTMGTSDVTLTAQWRDETVKYAVTYDLNGASGDAPTSPSKAAGDVFSLAAAPTWAGHAFDGWLCNIDSEVKAAGASYTMTAAPTTFTAQWHDVDCKIYSLTGAIGSAEVTAGTATVSADALVLSNSAARIKLTPATGETFKTGDVITISGAPGNIAKKFSAYVYAADGSTKLATLTVANAGDLPLLSGTLSGNADYVFLARIDGTTQNIYTCEVHRSCAEGTAAGLSYATASVDKLTTDAAFTNPLTNANSLVIAGYGSSDAAVATVDAAGQVTIVGAGSATITAYSAVQTKAGTLYAAGTASYTLTVTAPPTYAVTYAAGGGEGTMTDPNSPYLEGAEVTLLANAFTAPASQEFDAWTVTETVSGNPVAVSAGKFTMPAVDVTVTATWRALTDKYTVHYMDEDGTTPLGADELVNVGEHPAGITATKPLFTFASWQLSGSDIALSAVSAAKDEEVTLTARWTKAYATSYDMEAYAASVGASKAGLEEELTAAGYAYTNINGIDNGHTHNYTYDGMKYKTDDGDLSFNVVAGKVVEVKTGHLPSNDAVIMNINGVADATVFEGADEASETHKTNYFYSAVEALYRLDVLASKGTCAVKAVTIRDPFTVSFEAHGDADPSALQGLPSVTLPDATNGTASLLGWFDAATGGNKIGNAGATYIPTANITLHAQWESVSSDNTLSDLKVGGVTVDGFDPAVHTYYVVLPYGTAVGDIPAISATANSAKAKQVAIEQAVWTGDPYNCYRAQANVQAEDESWGYYDVRFSFAPKDGASIFKAELTSATTATYSGIYADADNSQIKLADDGANGYKFSGTSNFIKMALDGGTFATGDLLTMTYSKDPQQGELAIYENTTKIVGTSFANHTLEFTAGADGLTELFIRRTSDNNFNGWVSVVEVTRVVNPMLTAITFAGEAGTINESLKTVTVTVPNATDLGSMTVVPTIVRNAPHATTPEAVITNAGAWVEGPNTYRIMDKDGDYTDYTVTITRAALSDDATLSSLTVNGQAIALADGVFDYSFELPYGTSSAPAVVATPHHVAAVATVDPCTVSGATITVVPESGVGDQKVYTLTFTISPWKEVVIWDGSYMTDVETSPDATGLAWEVNGFGSISNYAVSYAAKDYTKYLPSGGAASASRNIELVVPAGYVAKFYVVGGSHSDSDERSAFIATSATKTDTHEGILTIVSPKRVDLAGGTSAIVGEGTYYLNPAASFDFYEIRAYLRPGYGRKVTNNIGTLCVDHNVPAGGALGATFYQIAGKNDLGKLVFEEVTSLNAGEPYVFQSTTGGITLYYGEDVEASPVAVKGMIGSFTGEHVDIDDSNKTNIMYIANNKLWDCSDLTPAPGYLDVVANRAYIFDYEHIGSAPAHAPGKRYIVVGKDQATGFDQLEASEAPMKLIIDGQMFILRGEKMYNANGQLVK